MWELMIGIILTVTIDRWTERRKRSAQYGHHWGCHRDRDEIKVFGLDRHCLLSLLYLWVCLLLVVLLVS